MTSRRSHEPEGKRPSAYRHRVSPRDVPAEVAAKRLGLTLVQFEEALPALIDRNFPASDPTTGLFDSVRVEAWMDERHGVSGGRQLRNADDGFAAKARSMLNGQG
jgi:hypothetical protein